MRFTTMDFIEGKNYSTELTRDKFIRDMNSAIGETRRAAGRLFDVFRNAHQSLSPYHFEQFLDAIDLEKSTINKLKKICSSDYICSNLEVLPSSWGTLYVIAGMDEVTVQELVDRNRLTNKTTRTEVFDIRDKVVQETTEYISNDTYENLVDNSPDTHWTDMPEFSNDEEVCHKELVMRFKTEKDYQEFQQLIQQSLSDKTKSIWFPNK